MLHSWDVTVTEAREIQASLAPRVVSRGWPGNVQLVAGADVSGADTASAARAVVVILQYPEMNVVEVASVEEKIKFPYVPGLLSFREIPLLVKAFDTLRYRPDLVIADGQGRAHPRRFGLASHLGLLLDLPTIGCAKSRLCGEHVPVGETAGSCVDLTDDRQVIGCVVRTKNWTKPVYVSVGNKIGLAGAVDWVLRCCRGYRIPEPTRLAHQAASGQDIAATGS
jgi:deoxyribonuclease V